MARLISFCRGMTAGKSTGEGRRLSEDQAEGEVKSRSTVATVKMFADGSGLFALHRDGKAIRIEWTSEPEALAITELRLPEEVTRG